MVSYRGVYFREDWVLLGEQSTERDSGEYGHGRYGQDGYGGGEQADSDGYSAVEYAVDRYGT